MYLKLQNICIIEYSSVNYVIYSYVWIIWITVIAVYSATAYINP